MFKGAPRELHPKAGTGEIAELDIGTRVSSPLPPVEQAGSSRCSLITAMVSYYQGQDPCFVSPFCP